MSDQPSIGSKLSQQSCMPCNRTTQALSLVQISSLLEQIDGWQHQGKAIVKIFNFDNYYQTIAFVNAVAWIANQQDHHPELSVSYKACKVQYSTHDINGLSENDFICAAKIDALL